jgi:hypothetical protein
VTDQIRMGGETMLAGLRRAYGGRVAALHTLPTATITLGRQTIVGVPFEFRELQDIESDVPTNCATRLSKS